MRPCGPAHVVAICSQRKKILKKKSKSQN
uniref:Putative BOI-related E3 ubiquitin-protein ligase 2 n=1 Tax=Rhizophora mucronata TaxID=61149 RepID=A0A2P2IVV8_RHIMU